MRLDADIFGNRTTLGGLPRKVSVLARINLVSPDRLIVRYRCYYLPQFHIGAIYLRLMAIADGVGQ